MNYRSVCLPFFCLMLAAGCTRIETGEAGLRIGFDKQTNMTELQPGSFNQTLIGSVLTFPVRDIAVELKDLTPQASDNSTLDDFDAMVIYSINPSSVGELWTTKSKGFHAQDEDDDWYLMLNYVTNVARSAAYKAVRKYEALRVADNRQAIETEIAESVRETLKAEKLDTALSVIQVQIRNVQPAASIVASANEVLRAQNEQKTKEIEVNIAEAEARKQAALSKVGDRSLALMKVQNEQLIAQAIKEGKVQTIIVPANFTMLGGIK